MLKWTDMNMQKIIFIKLRFVMAFIFLWAFFDKTFGLGFATVSGKAWVYGGSPTSGFLSFGTHGPFVEFFKSLSGMVVVDWLFMTGLLFIGLTLLFNKYVKWGAIAGIIMMLLMWLSLIPPENNPIVDEHIVYALVLALLAIKSSKGELDIR
jgi:thiosulfate dehydrogenase [quinone] large subunit